VLAAGLQNIEFVSVSTDSQALRNNAASMQLQIGQSRMRGRGAGGNPVIGRKAALEDEERLCTLLANPRWDSSLLVWAAALELGRLR